MTRAGMFVAAAALAAAPAVVGTGAATGPQTGTEQLQRGRALWDQRLSSSAIAALEDAARDKATAAEAHEALGRIFSFKGWQQESVFPGWHDEPAYRDKAIAALKAAIAEAPDRVSAKEALRSAEMFAASPKVDPAPPRPEVRSLDERLQALAARTTTPIADLVAAIDARIAAQADPAPYFTGAQIMIDRGEYDRAIALADRGAAASDRFIKENSSAYQMSGKLQSAFDRGRAAAADLAGWALFQKKDYKRAGARLEEAERLSQGADLANQFHLGELARAEHGEGPGGNAARARDHYLNALGLSGGAAPLRERVKAALAALPGNFPKGGADFDAWLSAELANRKDARMVAALKSLVDRPLPTLALTTVDGRPFDTASLKDKVLVLNFFASWCGLCRAELPHLKAVFAKYQADPRVAFLLVSIDEDSKRLQNYMDDMKFPFAVARMKPEDAERIMGFDNVPQTFYVDRRGIVRYHAAGVESHGDSPARVSWYIDRLNNP